MRTDSNGLVLVLKNALKRLRAADSEKIFHEPVNSEEVPDYLTVVHNPMDLSSMNMKLATGVRSGPD